MGERKNLTRPRAFALLQDANRLSARLESLKHTNIEKERIRNVLSDMEIEAAKRIICGLKDHGLVDDSNYKLAREFRTHLQTHIHEPGQYCNLCDMLLSLESDDKGKSNFFKDNIEPRVSRNWFLFGVLVRGCKRRCETFITLSLERKEANERWKPVVAKQTPLKRLHA